MRLVEEEDQLRLVGIADLGKLLEQLGEEPEQEGRIELGRGHQPVGGEDVDDSPASVVEGDEIVDVERRLAEEAVAALRAELEERALDGADAGLRDVAVGDCQLVGAIGAIGEHRLEVVQVEQEKPVLVGDVEDDGEHAFLDLVQIHQPGEHERAHFGDGGADRMALPAEQVPELDRIVVIGPARIPDLGRPGGEGIVELAHRRAGHCEAAQIALHVGDEDRHSGAREAFGETLQGDGLAGAGRPGDQAVTVGPAEHEPLRLAAAQADEDRGFVVHAGAPCCVASYLRSEAGRQAEGGAALPPHAQHGEDFHRSARAIP